MVSLEFFIDTILPAAL